MTATTIEKAEKYLECFLPGKYSLDRAERHTELIKSILIDEKIAFTKADLFELKMSTQDITDNLDKHIELPISSFEVSEYSDKLVNVLNDRIRTFIKESYDSKFRAYIADLRHALINAAKCIPGLKEPREVRAVEAAKGLLNLIAVIAGKDPNSLKPQYYWGKGTEEDLYKCMTTIMRCVLLDRIHKLFSDPPYPCTVFERTILVVTCLSDKIAEGEITKRVIIDLSLQLREDSVKCMDHDHYGLLSTVLYLFAPYNELGDKDKKLADEALAAIR